MILNSRWVQLEVAGVISTGLLLLSSFICVFKKGLRRLGLLGFLVSVLFVLGDFLLPKGGVRF
jgi:hypothetical protein